MSDCRLNVGFAQHPKFKGLCRRLGEGAGLCLLKLWAWTAANRPAGNLAGLSDEMIAVAVDWPGEAGAFVGALADFRLLDGEEAARSLHDWAEHQPWAYGFGMRSAKARWNAIKRYHGAAEADRQVPEWAAHLASSNATEHAQHATSNAPSPSPSPSPSPKSKAKSIAPAALELPDWLSPDDWEAWHAYRQRRGKGWTDHAQRLSVRTLDRLRRLGHSPRAVIEQSIERGYTGLFEIDGGGNGRNRNGVAGRIAAYNRERGI